MPDREMPLRHGMNPHQQPARVIGEAGLPFVVRGGQPGYINLLDALNAWQLVRELKRSTGRPAAASFKHVSPVGAAVAVPLSEQLARSCAVEGLALSPLAQAYVRARGADRVSAFGDWAALSDVVDVSTAEVIGREVSDGVVAPGFAVDALDVLRRKKGGTYAVLEIDPEYEPGAMERRDVFGVTLEQRRNDVAITPALLENAAGGQKLPATTIRDMLVALTALKYTQSNSVALAIDGQVVGVGAGQQSRIHCTRLACDKADIWKLRQHPRVLGLPLRPGLSRPERDNAIDGFLRHDLTPEEERVWRTAFTSVPARLNDAERTAWIKERRGAVLGSDGFIPFRDNIDRAARSGVSYVVQPGGSRRDEEIVAACAEYGIAMVLTGLRLFHH